MRIYLRITNNKEPVPFNYQQYLTGAFHKWLGKNKQHDKLSLYSFSFLQGGKSDNGCLSFNNGSVWFISSWNIDLIKKLINGIKADPTIAFGMEAFEIILEEDPDLSKKEVFEVGSPVFVKRTIENKEKHYIFDDPETEILLTETLRNKLKTAQMEDETLKVSFVTDYLSAKTKLYDYNGIKNRANLCPVRIIGKPETKAFAWNVGIGNSTGIGFGSLK